MKTVTLTQKEYNRARELCYNDNDKFEASLKERIKKWKPVKDQGVLFYERYHKSKMMLDKLQFEKYDISSMEYEGSGEETQITYLEYKTGEALTEDELWELWHDQNKLYQELIIAKKG